MLINTAQISEKFQELGIEELAKSCKFIKRPSKLTGTVFVMSYMVAFSQNSRACLSHWASAISQFIASPYSPQALHYKSDKSCLAFCKALCERLLSSGCLRGMDKRGLPRWTRLFKDIVLEDSSGVRVSKKLESYFPGSSNQNASGSMLRLQFRVSLFGLNMTNLGLTPYTSNDQSFAGDIVKSVKAGMLVLRDMGYFTVDAIRGIIAAEAYFITRWNTQVNVYTRGDSHEDVRAILHGSVANIVDIPVVLGSKTRVPMRLVAFRLPGKAKADKVRKQKAKDKKCKTRKRSQQYYDLLGWAIYLTNVEAGELDAGEIEAIYSLRWRVENFFKMLKSCLDVDVMFANKDFLDPDQIRLRVYLTAIYVAGVLMPAYNWCNDVAYKTKSRYVSLEKFSTRFKNEFCKILDKQMDTFLTMVLGYCLYDKRKTRLNFMEIVYQHNISRHRQLGDGEKVP